MYESLTDTRKNLRLVECPAGFALAWDEYFARERWSYYLSRTVVLAYHITRDGHSVNNVRLVINGTINNSEYVADGI